MPIGSTQRAYSDGRGRPSLSDPELTVAAGFHRRKLAQQDTDEPLEAAMNEASAMVSTRIR